MEKSSGQFTMSSRMRSIHFAMQGIIRVIRHEHNARIHLVAAAITSGLGLLLRISRVEWMVVLLCIALVIVTEIVNTALEKLVDLVSPEINEQAREIKDISAAAVLVAAVIALITGMILFLPHITALI
jgi:diacylglycerol kinase